MKPMHREGLHNASIHRDFVHLNIHNMYISVFFFLRHQGCFPNHHRGWLCIVARGFMKPLHIKRRLHKITIQGWLHKAIQRWLCKALRGFLFIYIQTYAHFSLFSNSYRVHHNALGERALKSPLHSRGFGNSSREGALYI